MDMEFEKLMTETKQDIWRQLLEVPPDYKYAPGVKHVKNYEYDSFNAELYLQNNGPGTVQRVLITMPKEFSGKLPAVVIPFYFPEAMIGFELETLEEELFGSAASDYLRAAELDARKTEVEERLMEIYEELE